MKMHFLMLACVALLCLFQNGFSQDIIEVVEGRSTTLRVPAGAQVGIGDQSIATAKQTQTGMISITGQRPGETSLTIYLPGGPIQEKTIRVKKYPRTLVAEVKEIFGEIEGVEFKVKSDEVVAEGAVYTEADRLLLERIMERYPYIINLVENKSEKLMVNIQVEFIEVTLTQGTDYNTNVALPAGIGTFTSITGSGPVWSFEAVAHNLFERVAYWKSHGLAKIIANPTLTVTNKDTATFLAGGEVPVPVDAGLGVTTVKYKKFGVILDVIPELTGAGKILVDIVAEVSGVDYSQRDVATGAPRLLTRRVASKGMVKEGETISLAGIYQKSVLKNKKRVPVLGHLLPFIFSSSSSSEEVKELIIMVTPRTPLDFNIRNYPYLEQELKNLKGK